jgi:hypothetical protein
MLRLRFAMSNGNRAITDMNTKEKEETIVSGATKMLLNLNIFLRRDRPKNFISSCFNLSNVDSRNEGYRHVSAK